MSDRRQNGSDDRADNYSDMSTDDLERLIDYAFFEDKVSLEQIDVMMQAYNKRDGIPKVDAGMMWEDFEQNYSGCDETFPYCDAENNPQADNKSDGKPPKRHIRLRRFGISAAAIITIMILFFASTAYGASAWQWFTNWTNRTIGFSRAPVVFQISYELVSLHAALEELGVTQPIAPTWIPERFALDYVKVIDMPAMTIVFAHFYYGDFNLIIQIDTVCYDSITLFQKDPGEPTIYRRNGINHYIFTNYGRTSALWTTGRYDGSFNGDITESEATLMIDSIYER